MKNFLSHAADAAGKMVTESTEFAEEKLNEARARRLADLVASGTAEEQVEVIKKAADFLMEKGIQRPEVIVTLGSGCGSYGDTIVNPVRISYEDIPGFPVSTAPGHRGQLIYGEKNGKKVACLSGRWHFYEGYNMKTIIFPLRVLARLGATRYVLTNASGWINESYEPGHAMLITDHINMSGQNPLTGPKIDEIGCRFPDMSKAYTPELREKVFREAEAAGIQVYQGVYAMMPGPSFETPAEIRMLRTLGADAVGMSSVPEAIGAAHAGLELIGISCLANPAAGMGSQPLLEQDVIDASNRLSADLQKLIDIAVNA